MKVIDAFIVLVLAGVVTSVVTHYVLKKIDPKVVN